MNEKPLHIKENCDIAPLVIMPGDPLRAKYISEKFLTDSKEVTSIRNMLGFTGFYQGVKVTVMGSGMGMPSMSIYAMELFKYFNVEKIIRIGTCGAASDKVVIPEIILADKAFTLSNFAYQYCKSKGNVVYPNPELNNSIIEVSKEHNKNIKVGGIYTVDVFGPYVDEDFLYQQIPDGLNLLGEEMEAFALLTIAHKMNKKASVLATCVDSIYVNKSLSSEERQESLDEMITLALDSIIK